MSSWRQFAESIRQNECAGTKETIGTKLPVADPFVPNVPIVSKAPPLNPTSILKGWHAQLAPLDFDHAPDGFALNRWRQLHGDSWWIYENFASRAVRDGWSAHDLFGVFVPHPGWGGLCDRLQGARNLKMEGRKAVWSRGSVPDWSCIGAGDSLITSGLN